MKNCAQFERLASLCENYPDAGLHYIASGEPVSILFLKRIEKTAPQLVDEIFNIEFEVEADFNPNSMYEMYSSDHFAIYEFMKRFYGKNKAESIVISRPKLWDNFLTFASKGLFEDGRIVKELKQLIERKEYLLVCKLLECCSKKYRNKVRATISKEEMLELFQNVYQTEAYYCYNESVFDVENMVKNNMFSKEVLEVYFSNLHCVFDYPKAVKTIVRKGGLEYLKTLNNYELNKILKKKNLL